MCIFLVSWLYKLCLFKVSCFNYPYTREFNCAVCVPIMQVVLTIQSVLIIASCPLCLIGVLISAWVLRCPDYFRCPFFSLSIYREFNCAVCVLIVQVVLTIQGVLIITNVLISQCPYKDFDFCPGTLPLAVLTPYAACGTFLSSYAYRPSHALSKSNTPNTVHLSLYTPHPDRITSARLKCLNWST